MLYCSLTPPAPLPDGSSPQQSSLSWRVCCDRRDGRKPCVQWGKTMGLWERRRRKWWWNNVEVLWAYSVKSTAAITHSKGPRSAARTGFTRMRSNIISMAAPAKAQVSGKTGKPKDRDVPSAETIINKFQQLRSEQRAIASKITEVEADKNEHGWVVSEKPCNCGKGLVFKLVFGPFFPPSLSPNLPPSLSFPLISAPLLHFHPLFFPPYPLPLYSFFSHSSLFLLPLPSPTHVQSCD